MNLKFNCGCSVDAGNDGYGGIDATNLKLCPRHFKEYLKPRKHTTNH